MEALTSIADALYAVPLDRFVAERGARSRAARDDGDRALAQQIAALAKPTTSAWLVNVMTRAGSADLAAILDLAEETARVQREGDRAALRALTTRRRELLARVVSNTAALAEDTGQRAGPGVLEEFERTLQAALADGDAATAVASGRLLRALRADGLEPVDLDGAVALHEAPGVVVDRSREAGTEPQPTSDAPDRGRREAEDRASAARDAASGAAARAAAAADRAAKAESEVSDQAAAVDELDHRIERLREQAGHARAALADATRHAADARAAAERADRTSAEARSAAAAADADLRSLDG